MFNRIKRLAKKLVNKIKEVVKYISEKIEENIIMKDYYVAIDFEHNEIGFYSKRICSINHIFYNQPDKVNDDLKNYWLGYLKKLLHNLYKYQDLLCCLSLWLLYLQKTF